MLKRIYLIPFIFIFLPGLSPAQETVPLKVYRIAASSVLPDNESQEYPFNIRRIIYDVHKAFDGDPLTAWSEGSEGPGIGEYIEIQFSSSVTINEIVVMPGFFNENYFNANNRVKVLSITFDDNETIELNFDDEMTSQSCSFRKTIFKKIKFEIKEVYPGSRWDDTCIAEIEFKLAGKKIEIDTNNVFSYQNNKYNLNDFDSLTLYTFTENNQRFSYYLANDQSITGGGLEGVQTGPFITEGTWSFDPLTCTFTVTYKSEEGLFEYRESWATDTLIVLGSGYMDFPEYVGPGSNPFFCEK